MRFKRTWLIFVLIIMAILLVIGLYFFKSDVNKNEVKNDESSKEMKISVIIPVYNTEKYLDECLKSVESQTFKNLEIICVNDGSTDSSPEILESHKSKDERIKVINQKNGGISVARNVGMSEVTGDYIVFLDSDDLISPSLCEFMSRIVSKNGYVDIAEFGSKSFIDGEENCNFNDFKIDDFKFCVYKREKKENPFETLGLELSVVWNKMWKTSFIKNNNLKFKEGLSSGEDTLFNFFAFAKATSSIKTENVFHGYRTNRPGSIMSETRALKNAENRVTICQEILSGHDKLDFDGSEKWSVDTSLNLIYENITKLDNKDKQKELSKKVLNVIEDYSKKYNFKISEDNKEKLGVLRSL